MEGERRAEGGASQELNGYGEGDGQDLGRICKLKRNIHMLKIFVSLKKNSLLLVNNLCSCHSF